MELEVIVGEKKKMTEEEILDYFGIDRIEIEARNNIDSRIAGNALIYYKHNPIPVRVPLFVRTPANRDPYVTPPIDPNSVSSPVTQGREIELANGRRMTVDRIFVPTAVLQYVREVANEKIKIGSDVVERINSDNNIESNTASSDNNSDDLPL